jgi:hypothetical protein
MASLASTLEKLTRRNKRTENIRRYIVVESIYQVCFFSDYFVLDKCSFFYLWRFFTLYSYPDCKPMKYFRYKPSDETPSCGDCRILVKLPPWMR